MNGSRSKKPKVIELVKWSTKEKKFEQLLYSLREVKNSFVDTRKTINLLSEINIILEKQQFQFPNKDIELFQRVRGVLLELWNLLLISCRNYTNYTLYKHENENKIEENNIDEECSENGANIQTPAPYLFDSNEYIDTFERKDKSKNAYCYENKISISFYSERDIQTIHKAIA